MNTDLLGDPLPEPLPCHSRLTDESQLAGHEVRAVFLETSGIWGHAGMVLVTATGCWMTFEAEEDGDEHYIRVSSDYSSKPVELVGYVPATILLQHNCITTADFARFEKMEKEHAETQRQRRANRLRSELAELEGGAS